AEQLEHIQSSKLVDSLDEFLGFPKFDPHGDAIPGKNGEIVVPFSRILSGIEPGQDCKIVAVNDNSVAFLQYAEKIGIAIGEYIHVQSREEFDQLLTVVIQGASKVVSEKFAENIFV